MEWTKPLSFLLAVLVALLVVGSVVELFRTTFADADLLVASAVTTVFVAVVVVATVAAGARDRQWLDNPDSYW